MFNNAKPRRSFVRSIRPQLRYAIAAFYRYWCSHYHFRVVLEVLNDAVDMVYLIAFLGIGAYLCAEASLDLTIRDSDPTYLAVGWVCYVVFAVIFLTLRRLFNYTPVAPNVDPNTDPVYVRIMQEYAQEHGYIYTLGGTSDQTDQKGS